MDGRHVIVFTGLAKPRSCRSAIFLRMLSIRRPRISGLTLIIFTGSAKPSSRRSAIFPRMLSIA